MTGFRILLCVLYVLLIAGATRADIFQWQYINPAVLTQGKQQSTTLCVDGAGVDAAPGAVLEVAYARSLDALKRTV